ncbi:MAG: hypothetical protein A2Y25_03290 [Candidatus Melainabacteria bacterium GWF2_37_15]|nr:MAG: hypothetical protein A2Y25_03290 [Candidatus Melainabacteria bacterium GWF2_37_15]
MIRFFNVYTPGFKGNNNPKPLQSKIININGLIENPDSVELLPGRSYQGNIIFPDKNIIIGEKGRVFGDITAKSVTADNVSVSGSVRFKDNGSKQTLRITKGTTIRDNIIFENEKGTVIIEKGARLKDAEKKVIGGKIIDLNKGFKVKTTLKERPGSPDIMELSPNTICNDNLIFPDKKIIIGENAEIFSLDKNKPITIIGKEVILNGNNNIKGSITAINDCYVGEKSKISGDIISEQGNIKLRGGNITPYDIYNEPVEDENIKVTGTITAKNGDVNIGRNCRVLGKTTAKNVNVNSTIPRPNRAASGKGYIYTALIDENQKDNGFGCTYLRNINAPEGTVSLKGNIVTESVDANNVIISPFGAILITKICFKDNGSEQVFKVKNRTFRAGDIVFENGNGTVSSDQELGLFQIGRIIGGKSIIKE